MRNEAERGFLAWVTRLVREHRDALIVEARRGGLEPEDALDATQDALVAFLSLPHARRLSDVLEDSRAFLLVMVRNQARNRRRRHAHARPHDVDPELLAAIGDDTESVEALVARAEAHVMALGCVERLGEVQRHVVSLRLLEDQPGHVVAERLGLSPNHVAVILHRAKARLRDCMRED